MKRIGNWAVGLATLMALASVGISAIADPPAAAAPVLPGAAPEQSGRRLAMVLDVERPAAFAQTPAPAQSGYLGSEACVVCHENYDKTIEATKHGFKGNALAPASKQGCESCHGPGEAHAQDPANVKPIQFGKVAAHAANTQCQQCHNRGEHALWDNSQHEARNLSCVTCHSVHSAKSPTGQLKTELQQDVCASCHRDKVAKLDRSGHMPVREGKMQCSTCHNTHGSTNVKLLRKGDSVSELCTSCHTEKRGPFLWEHAPGRDGCVTCHDPHGSSNERMLVAKPPILCQRCHVGTRHPSTIYDALLIGSSPTSSVRIFARSCVTCHSAIHGSNHPSGQRFIR